MAFQGCPDASNDQAFIPPPRWVIYAGYPQRAWWFKVAHWQHLQLLDNESLWGGQDSMSAATPGMYSSPEERRANVETLDDGCLSQMDDSVILVNTS